MMRGNGAYIMGRRLFGGGDGEWDLSWCGWWGDEPPYHAPVFVLTHHPRPLLEMGGGTTFTFVMGGVADAVKQARASAGERDVAVAGGANVLQQFIAARLLDEVHLHLAPVLLGAGERLFENVGDPVFEPVEVIASPAVTHIRYRVTR
jgi:dihydrofolate reductase